MNKNAFLMTWNNYFAAAIICHFDVYSLFMDTSIAFKTDITLSTENEKKNTLLHSLWGLKYQKRIFSFSVITFKLCQRNQDQLLHVLWHFRSKTSCNFVSHFNFQNNCQQVVRKISLIFTVCNLWNSYNCVSVCLTVFYSVTLFSSNGGIPYDYINWEESLNWLFPVVLIWWPPAGEWNRLSLHLVGLGCTLWSVCKSSAFVCLLFWYLCNFHLVLCDTYSDSTPWVKT